MRDLASAICPKCQVYPCMCEVAMYQFDTSNASKEAMELFSCGKSACFAVKVEDGSIIATAPIGWRLRHKSWAWVLKFAASGGVKATRIGGLNSETT